jgi:FAD/FMN-containing dehydrogenase
VGGLTLGGGLGWLMGKHGMAVDNLRAVELVTAAGEVVRASAEEHPDLFWAVRGGGGNFGVVTELEAGLVRVEQLYGGGLYLPGECAPSCSRRSAGPRRVHRTS